MGIQGKSGPKCSEKKEALEGLLPWMPLAAPALWLRHGNGLEAYTKRVDLGLANGRGQVQRGMNVPLEWTLPTENARLEMNLKYHGPASSLLHSSLNSQHRA